jgi:F0F1-type ATP synthase membrane subunit b/b'
MVEIKDSQISAGINELEKTFQEYKKKLEYTEQEAQQIIDLALKKADTILKENQSTAQQMVDEIRQAAKSEADKVMAEANNKAIEAETMIKEQMSKARKTADEMMQVAKENSVILMNETGRLIDEASRKTENILNQFQTQMQSEFAKLTTKIDKAKNTPDIRNTTTRNEASASVEKKNDSENFKGQTKIVVIPPYNEVQTKELIELLKQIPGIKIGGTSTMEDNFSISLSVVEAIPLKKILSSISLVESSEFTDGTIKLKLKRYKIGGLPYY